MQKIIFLFLSLLVLILTTAVAEEPALKVIMTTSKGEITIELYPNEAPISVENFLSYADSGFYNGTIFHRVISGFMIQGGGYTENFEEKASNPPIKNEATNGLSNKRGTLAMARTSVIDSATCQFFINHVDNSFLDHRDDTPQGYGYAVFGKVVKGMEVVDSIANAKTETKHGHQDVPRETITIISVRRLN